MFDRKYEKNKNNEKNDIKKENIKNEIKQTTETKERILINIIDKLNYKLEKSNIIELSYLIGNKKELFKRNLLAGISRGIGIGIGVTIISAILIYLLQKIVLLNIPVIGKYIADIAEIIQNTI